MLDNKLKARVGISFILVGTIVAVYLSHNSTEKEFARKYKDYNGKLKMYEDFTDAEKRHIADSHVLYLTSVNNLALQYGCSTETINRILRDRALDIGILAALIY
jgi:hypothetical protein